MFNVSRRASVVTVLASLILLLAACTSDGVEQARVVAVTPTALATTPPLSVPTETSTPDPAPAPAAELTSTPQPAAAAALSTATVEPSPVATVSPTATAEAAVIESPTPAPTSTAEAPEPEEDPSAPDATPEPAAPTAVVASGELPLECYDAQVQVYRAYVDGVDALSFEGGRVSCRGAGTNAVSAAGSYRHSSGLIVQRNADFLFTDDGNAYIPYSGSLHFCLNGQPASAPFRADTVPSLLIVIDNEARRQVAQGATGPASFSDSGTQC